MSFYHVDQIPVEDKKNIPALNNVMIEKSMYQNNIIGGKLKTREELINKTTNDIALYFNIGDKEKFSVLHDILEIVFSSGEIAGMNKISNIVNNILSGDKYD